MFALSINNPIGYECFEYALETIASGVTCLAAITSIAQSSIAPIRFFDPNLIKNSSSVMVVTGAALGLFGALIAVAFAYFHWFFLANPRRSDWDSSPVKLSMFGWIGICTIGALIPQTMFWGEYEMKPSAPCCSQILSNMSDQLPGRRGSKLIACSHHSSLASLK